MQLAAPARQTSGRFPAVYPNMPELLAVVALCKAVLNPVGLHPYCYVAEGCQAEDFLRLIQSWQGDEKKGEVSW
jgi:hypothetical protein